MAAAAVAVIAPPQLRDAALVIGNLTAAELALVRDAVTAALQPGAVQSIALAPATSSSPGAAVILPPNHDPSRPAMLMLTSRGAMEGLCKQLHTSAAIEHKLKKAMAAIAEYQKQQQRVIADFGTLSQKYQATKATLQHVLWRRMPQLAEFGAIPPLDEGMEESEARVGPYALGQLVGAGHFAKVKEILERTGEEDGRALVLKAIDKAHVKHPQSLLRVAHEIEALRLLRHHPNVTRLYEVLHGKQGVYLVCERLSTDLYEIIGLHPDGASGVLAQRIVKPILSAIAHVHAHGFVHRDIKPENILVTRLTTTDELLVKVCDFGLCCPRPPPGTLLTDFCGSPGFLCPEMLVERQYDGVLADHFSIGCVLLELLLPAGDFARAWMEVFNEEAMADGLQFKHRLRGAYLEVEAMLREKLGGAHDELLALALGLLKIDAFERFSTTEVQAFLLGAAGALPSSSSSSGTDASFSLAAPLVDAGLPPSAAVEGLALDGDDDDDDSRMRTEELQRASRRSPPLPVADSSSRRALSPVPSPGREIALAATPLASRPAGLMISSPKAIGGKAHGVRSTLRAQALLGSGDPAAAPQQRQRDKDVELLRSESPGTPLATSLPPPSELLLEGLGSPLAGTPVCSPKAALLAAATAAGGCGES